MEALLEKGADVESWNDERMDELSRRVDAGFEKATTKDEMKLRFGEVDKRFDKVDHELGRVNDRLDKLFYIQIAFMGSLAIGLLTLMVGLLTDRI